MRRFHSILITCLFFSSSLMAAEPLVKFEKFELTNGLRVILSEDHSNPVVGCAIYYNVGSRNEVRGRTGFAHLFEHMMFQGSQNVPRNMHSMWIGRAGGNDNGSTNQDRTNYFATLPSNQLEIALWLESDRMKALNITKENFENQRATVKEEKRQSYDNQPYSEGRSRLMELVFESYPYQHTVIGSMEDLDAAELKDVQAFFNTYYAPNNAVLAVAGDIDPAQARKLVEKYFGPVPARVPPPQVVINEPERIREKKITVTDKYANLPAVYAGFGIPKRGHPDVYALDLLSDILLAGDSSRLNQKLVKEKEVAASVSGGANAMRGAGVFMLNLMVKPERDPADVFQMAIDEFERVKKEPVSSAELQKAKNRYRSTTVSGLERALNRAMQLCEYELDGDPNRINTQIDQYMAVTPEDIQRVAKKYFTVVNRSSVTVLPAAAKLADESFRKTVPFSEKALSYKIPASKEKSLENGLLIQAFEDRSLPKVTIQFYLKGGAYFEPEDKPGISTLVAGLMKEGTRNAAGKVIQEKLDALGASVDVSSGPDSIVVTVSTLKEYLGTVLDLAADVILNPAFPEDELQKQIRRFQTRLLQQRSSPLYLASQMLYQQVFGNHPYAKISTPAGAPYVNTFQLLPSENCLKTVKRQDLADYYNKFFVPNQTLVVAVGDFTVSALFDEIDKRFSNWKKGPAIEARQVALPPAPSKRVLYLIDRPGSVQSYILMGNRIFERRNSDYLSLLVANKILGGGRHIGGGGTGRLFLNLREEKGWTYGCYSWIMPFVNSGMFAINAEVRTEVTGSAVKEILKEVDRIRKGDANDEDLKYSKSFLSSVLGLVLEGSRGVAGAAAELKLNQMPADYWDKYAAGINAVTSDQMRKAAENYIALDNALVVVVGDASKIESELRPLCQEVVKFDKNGKRIG